MKKVKFSSFTIYDILFYTPFLGVCFWLAYLSYDGWISIVYFAVGAFLTCVLTSLFHELVHIAVGSFTGFKTVGFSFSVFSFDFTGKKVLTFKLNPYAGETEMIPTKEGYFVKRYAACLWGGIVGGGIFSAAIALLYFLTSGAVRGSFAFFPLSFASFLLNALPLVYSGDGYTLTLLRRKDDGENAEKYFAVAHALFKGESFSEMDGALFEKPSPGLFYSRLRAACLMRAEENADKREIVGIVSEAEEDGSAMNFAREIFCACCLIGDDEKASRYEEFSLVNGDDADEIRTLVLKAYRDQDEQYLSVALKTAYALADRCYLKGERKFERKILDFLYENKRIE